MIFDPLYFTDKNNQTIQLGDIVKAKIWRGEEREYVFVFSIPQHRFGCLEKERYDHFVENKDNFDRIVLLEPYVLDWPDLDLYYTPRSSKKIIKK